MTTTITLLLVGVLLLGLIVVALLGGRFVRRRMLDPPGVRAAAQALRTASMAGPPLRNGLTKESAAQALPFLLALLETPGVALCDPDGRSLGTQGEGAHHLPPVEETVRVALRLDRRQLVTLAPCEVAGCPVTRAVVVPLVVTGDPAGALVVLTGSAVGPFLIRAADETSRFIVTQLELADLDASRADLARAEVRALRAQISPHFIYNALTAIASFITTDPARARELVLEFADFTRYSFRRQGEFTTLAEELRSIHSYLELERSRFGDRLAVTLRIAPETLSTVIPFLSVQPIVENAVRHGLEPGERGGGIRIEARDDATHTEITVEDDGVGMDPEQLRALLNTDADGAHVGIRNVDTRLRQLYGPGGGLVVETNTGAGTLVRMRIPKSQPQHALDTAGAGA